MKIQDIRRANLQKWVDSHGTPSNEKSYFSQILSGGGSFGERAARRLEEDYKMGDGFLDQSDVAAKAIDLKIPDNYVDANEISKLITFYVQSTKKGRLQIMEASELSEKLGSRARGKASND